MASPDKWERLRPLQLDTLRVSEVHGGRHREALPVHGERAGRRCSYASAAGAREEAAESPSYIPGRERCGGPGSVVPRKELCDASLRRGIGAGFPGKVIQCEGVFFLACVTYSLFIELSML